ncbi:hypothetical protein ASG31_12620 [Chryseobacterium sp. Leaf404]|uniref:hypothetical protein n=1 Tax=unclassified Chryseobacterium TaxID=2593645 RepID=UPI0006FFA17F|nr:MULTISPECIES: hypothetical protein [unclassified Chryseobacterium]KQT16353.1 hypothetical protein ASG31_12620 [Chryseobacterium sp. Leaf404]
MQKNIFLTVLLFFLVSCYTYQVKKPAEVLADQNQPAKKSADNSKAAAYQISPEEAEMQAQKTAAAVAAIAAPVDIKEKLAPTKNYRIKADGKTYKIVVDKWEKDSLVAHPVSRPNDILKFHKNQIDSENIAEKRFSQPIADIITVLAYVGIGVGIYALIKGM